MDKVCWFHKDYMKTNPYVCKKGLEQSTESGGYSCKQDCATYLRCKRAFEYGGFPNRFWNMPDEYQIAQVDTNSLMMLQRITSNIESFIKSGQNLYIHSLNSGCGKTMRAVMLSNAFIRAKALSDAKNVDVWTSYVNIPKLVSDYDIYEKLSYENSNRQEFLAKMANLNRCELIVWDDFAFSSRSYLESTTLRAILASRITEGLSNIIVSSYSLEELTSQLSKMDLQRLRSSCIVIELKSPDFRFTGLDSYCK